MPGYRATGAPRTRTLASSTLIVDPRSEVRSARFTARPNLVCEVSAEMHGEKRRAYSIEGVDGALLDAGRSRGSCDASEARHLSDDRRKRGDAVSDARRSREALVSLSPRALRLFSNQETASPPFEIGLASTNARCLHPAVSREGRGAS